MEVAASAFALSSGNVPAAFPYKNHSDFPMPDSSVEVPPQLQTVAQQVGDCAAADDVTTPSAASDLVTGVPTSLAVMKVPPQLQTVAQQVDDCAAAADVTTPSAAADLVTGVPTTLAAMKVPTQLQTVAQQVGDCAAADDVTTPSAAADLVTGVPTSLAAMKVQKVYRSYRTRRKLADSVVFAEELWWQALDFARLNRSTISFFNYSKPEAPATRWNRVTSNASRVGKGLLQDAKAQKLAFQHWIEAIDARHRYGHSLHYYYDEWCKEIAGQPFFYWLDVGFGKEVDLKDCPRSKLRQQCIKYLGPKERELYEYVIVDGKFLHKLTGKPLNSLESSPGSKSKWIFVMSTSKRLYTGEKKKGLFHHSSFLAGGATLAAGRLDAVDGVLKTISAYSGHYKPSGDCLNSFLSFLKENGVDPDKVKICSALDDNECNGNGSMSASQSEASVSYDVANEEEEKLLLLPSETTEAAKAEMKVEYKRTLSGGLQSPKRDVPRTAILQRINSKKAAKSYQLGHQLSNKWSTGAGPRIGCIADYPVELRLQALEFTSLSPSARSCPPVLTQHHTKP